MVAMGLFHTIHMDKKRCKALSLAKGCYSMKLELLTNAIVVDDAIRFVSESEKSKDKEEQVKSSASSSPSSDSSGNEDNNKESMGPDYDYDDEKSDKEGEGKQEQQIGEITTRNQVF